MKIAIIGTAWPYRGGLAAYSERLAHEFIKEGHRADIFTFTLQYPDFLFPGKTQFTDTSKPAGLKIVRCINSVNPLSWFKSGRMLKKESYDVAVFCYWMPFIAPCYGSMALAMGNKIKKVALVHNIISHEKSFLDKALSPYFVHRMDGFVAMSKSVLTDIALFDKTNKPKAYSPHPVYDHFGPAASRPEAIDQLALDENKRYVLFFGLVRAYKGLDLLLRAFADSRVKALNVKLLVAGEFYDNPQQYNTIIEDNNLQDVVEIHNEFIPDEMVRFYFAASDLIAQPYKSATQSGVSQIAYHFEKPMLVSNVGGLPEIVPDGKAGYVVAAHADAIADALVDFFTNNKMEEMTEGVKEEKKRFLWSRMTSTIIEVANKI